MKSPVLRARILPALGAAVVALVLSSCANESVPGVAATAFTGGVETSSVETSSDPRPIDPDPVVELTDVTYVWSTGSVPAPWNHSWRFELIGTTATFHWEAHYTDDGFVEDRTFELTAQQAEDYRTTVATITAGYESQPGEDMSVGGATARLSWVDATGGTGTITDIGALESTGMMSEPLYEAAEAAIPADVFAEVSSAYEAWADEHD